MRVLNAISANPFRDWKTKELAAIGKVSYSLMRTLFRNAGQGTIHQHIQRTRLDQARLLLADKRLSIKDVAGQLNFSSEFYFSHFFRHQTGMSPTQFSTAFERVSRLRREAAAQCSKTVLASFLPLLLCSDRSRYYRKVKAVLNTNAYTTG